MYWALSLGLFCSAVASQEWTPIVVKNVALLGPQISPDVTNISRDGGFSALVNGNIVWLYDDTECFDSQGRQLSFVSNTAVYASEPNNNLLKVADFGVVEVGDDNSGNKSYAVLANTSVGTGGWIPFSPVELDFNNQQEGAKERLAIWPGTSPTPFSITQSFLYTPVVYVDMEPLQPSKEYQARGITLVTITALASGPIAARQEDFRMASSQVAFGGFSTLLGSVSTDDNQAAGTVGRDVYLLGTTPNGLQIARVGLSHIKAINKYTYFNPKDLKFSTMPPDLDLKDRAQIYLPGSYTSGSTFYSPYFLTFIMIYFNKFADSTFYIRYLDLENPLRDHDIWIKGGKNGKGIQPEDAEALVKYTWSSEQRLYASPPGRGGFNYAGNAHPEYFNRQYFAKSLYPDKVHEDKRKNIWYGLGLVKESDAGGDGKYLLLSWTSQLQEDKESGVYQVQLAVVQFDDIPTKPGASASSRSTTMPTAPVSPLSSGTKHKSTGICLNAIPKGWLVEGKTLSSLLSHQIRDMFSIIKIGLKTFLLLSVSALGALIL